MFDALPLIQEVPELELFERAHQRLIRILLKLRG